MSEKRFTIDTPGTILTAVGGDDPDDVRLEAFSVLEFWRLMYPDLTEEQLRAEAQNDLDTNLKGGR
jgi:hypothetical protein